MKILIAIILFATGAFGAAPVSVYISPTGNDSTGDGTTGNPWRTPQKALGQLNLASDPKTNTVVIKAGTYTAANDNIHQDWFGDFGNNDSDRVYVVGEGSSTVWENGGRPRLAPTGGSTRVWEFGQNRPAGYSYVTASNIWFDATNRVSADVVKLDYNATHHTFINCEISGSDDNHGVLISNNAGIDDTYHKFIDCYVHDNGWNYTPPNDVHNFYVHASHNTFINTRCNRVHSHDFHMFSGTIYFNVISNAWLSGNVGVGFRSGSGSNKVYNVLFTPYDHVQKADNPIYLEGWRVINDDGNGNNEYYNITVDGYGDPDAGGMSITSDNNIIKNFFSVNTTNVGSGTMIGLAAASSGNLIDGYCFVTNITTSGSAINDAGSGNVIQNNVAAGDAGFVNWQPNTVAFLNWRITTNSVAYNSGITVASLGHDIIGVSRPQGASFDLGAFEYDAGSPPELPPDPGTGLTATAVSSSQINLSWTDNDDDPQETSWRIERSTTGGGVGFSEIDTTGPDVTTYNDTGRSASTTYYYRVRARNAAGDSAYTSEANDTTDPAGAAPNAPSGLAVAQASPAHFSLTISWNDNSGDETSFRVERSLTGGGAGFTEVGSTAANATSYRDDGLAPATTYYYRVRARNGNGDSAYTSEASQATATKNNAGKGRWRQGKRQSFIRR